MHGAQLPRRSLAVARGCIVMAMQSRPRYIGSGGHYTSIHFYTGQHTVPAGNNLCAGTTHMTMGRRPTPGGHHARLCIIPILPPPVRRAQESVDDFAPRGARRGARAPARRAHTVQEPGRLHTLYRLVVLCDSVSRSPWTATSLVRLVLLIYIHATETRPESSSISFARV